MDEIHLTISDKSALIIIEMAEKFFSDEENKRKFEAQKKTKKAI